MATADGKPVFIDSNVLVFANVEESPLHASALSAIKQHRAAGSPLWISCQVLREFLAVRSRPDLFEKPSPASELAERVRYFRSRFHVAGETPVVTDRLLTLLEQVEVSGKQVHDANIVATMLVNGIRHLLTDNRKDFERFSSFVTIIPLEPAAVQ